MNSYIKLTDGTTFSIEDGASLDHIQHIAESEQAAVALCNKITDANLKQLGFYQDEIDTPYGEYHYLTINRTPIRYTNDKGQIIVEISLREKNALEKQLAILEEKVEVQDAALLDLSEVISELMEGGSEENG